MVIWGFTINFVALLAGATTIIWFFRDMRRENGKLLKDVSGILRDSQQMLKEYGRDSLQIMKDSQQIARDSQQIARDSQQIFKDHTLLLGEILQAAKKGV